jgi:hypothetical protein
MHEVIAVISIIIIIIIIITKAIPVTGRGGL